MNQAYLISKIRELDAQGVEVEDIAERFAIDPSRVCQLRKLPARALKCDRCGVRLSLYTVRTISEVDFCRSCQCALFADHDAAVAQYPNLFCE